jgi:hypothetical protein
VKYTLWGIIKNHLHIEGGDCSQEANSYIMPHPMERGDAHEDGLPDFGTIAIRTT